MNIAPEIESRIGAEKSSIIKLLLYYSLFDYPLTFEEIISHCQLQDCSREKIQAALNELCSNELIFSIDRFFLLKNDPALVERRVKGNLEAEKAMPKAIQRVEFISRFPFVRCVCISGSLSKNYFDETTDVDFFIITEPNRLWLCRSLLILYKKLFLFNSKKYFCVNYFIDSNSLVIPDQNIFTATEIITLLPVFNTGLHKTFFEANNWVKKNYPNAPLRMSVGHLNEDSSAIKTFLEKIFSATFGEWLDKYFFRATLNHWKKKFDHFNEVEFEINMRSRKNVSKHHPQGFQFRVLHRFNSRCRAFEERHQITLS